MGDRSGYRYRSLFWPVLLIGVGVLWLLANFNLISGSGFGVLLRFWPLLLVWIGLDILFGHRSPWLGAGLGLLALAVAVVLAVGGPSWGWNVAGGNIETHRYTESVNGATSATVRIDVASAPVTLRSSRDTAFLFDATIKGRGTPSFQVSGGAQRDISFTVRRTWNWFDWAIGRTSWDITLSGAVPTALELDRGSGSVDADLRGVLLTSFVSPGGSGAMNLQLPGNSAAAVPLRFGGGSGSTQVAVAEGATLDATVDMGSGSFAMTLGAGTQASLQYSGGSGSFGLTVPSGAALQVDVRDSGSGRVGLPSGMTQVSKGEGDIGLWETPGFAAAARKITVVVARMGSGSVDIR